MSSALQSARQLPRTQSWSGGPDAISSAVFQRAQAAQRWPPMNTSSITRTFAGLGVTVTSARSLLEGRTPTRSLPRL